MNDLLLDTDIGSDVDDALALALIVGSPELRLLGISTVYGDTRLRARLARRYLSFTAADKDLHIAAGAEDTLSGKAVWWAGHEGALFDDLEGEEIAQDAVSHLCTTVADAPGRVDILSIGPLTNIALALDRDPAFAANVRRLVVMGGDFGADPVAEHNITADVAAAQRVFASDLDIVIGGLDLTLRVRLGAEHVERIEQSGRLGSLLGTEIRSWWTFTGAQENTPHDPILALWIARPDLFDHRRARVRVDDDGRTWATPADDGEVTILDTSRPDLVRDEILARIASV